MKKILTTCLLSFAASCAHAGLMDDLKKPGGGDLGAGRHPDAAVGLSGAGDVSRAVASSGHLAAAGSACSGSVRL